MQDTQEALAVMCEEWHAQTSDLKYECQAYEGTARVTQSSLVFVGNGDVPLSLPSPPFASDKKLVHRDYPVILPMADIAQLKIRKLLDKHPYHAIEAE